MQAETQSGAARLLAQAWQILDAEPDSARVQAEDLLRTAPESADVALLLAAARRRLGDVGGALTVLAPHMSPAARSPIAWFEWGMILSEMNDDEDAVAALRNAVSLAPAFTGAWRALGDQLMVLGAGVAA